MNKLFQGLLIIFMISGCDVAETISMKNVSEDTQIVTSNAAANLSVVKRTESGEIICVNSAPDAVPSVSSQFTLADSGSEGFNVSEAEMSGRTPVLLMMRDSNFNLCKMYLNGVISKEQYVEMTTKQLEVFEKLMSAEIEHTQITISEKNVLASKPSASLFRDTSASSNSTSGAFFGGSSSSMMDNSIDGTSSASIEGSSSSVTENSDVSNASEQDCPAGTKWDASISMCSF